MTRGSDSIPLSAEQFSRNKPEGVYVFLARRYVNYTGRADPGDPLNTETAKSLCPLSGKGLVREVQHFSTTYIRHNPYLRHVPGIEEEFPRTRKTDDPLQLPMNHAERAQNERCHTVAPRKARLD